MSQREKIIEILRASAMTQAQIAYEMYGDNKHAPSIYLALMSLVDSGVVKRYGRNPSYYSLCLDTQIKIENVLSNICDNKTESSEHVIILNKPFLGDWLSNDGNIGHEVIDFLQTDNGEYYVYNNPWGVCPENIWVEGTKNLTRFDKEKYLAKYLVLTSETRNKNFDILYVIELAEKFHQSHKTKSVDNVSFRNAQEKIKVKMRERDIKYNGKYLDEIYKDDDSLFLTFRASRIYKAEKPIFVSGVDYNFQRNKGYLYSDKQFEDYEYVNNLIVESIDNGSLQEFIPRSVNNKEINRYDSMKTFLDLIRFSDNEQAYTNILYSVLRQNNLMTKFCIKFNVLYILDEECAFDVRCETKVVDGRMDICAESENQRIVIENKVFSGLNGINTKDSISQLSTYYNWAKEKKMHPICFVVAPNSRISELKNEVRIFDNDMLEKYQIVSYGEIADFLEAEYLSGNISPSYEYYSLMTQIIIAFRKLSYSTKEDLYARMFFEASILE